MKNSKGLSLFVCLTVAVFIFGCAPKKADNAQQAIEEAKAKGSVSQQVDYLVAQGNAFVSSKDYDQAVAVANHVLTNLDQNSQAAKDILLKAKEDMQKSAEGAVKDLKDTMGGLGK